ncbi:uncharacterized protein MONOS_9541 [Monocercomonoides exilis]|uniref:uncharacterized protein n=1 Tax=Monocercomonoides exilis TaxID=2049356 RepID=UPI00355A1F18|nr:hypothetical protein MONOS_9541 [Monocercomonoides exilis]|eukprot:MONOS_9541.1-p1 / transcript=MONOS_9541.1 / gene=MONOS_9541 / organism=Monocercomonoides_exilis_PA203 / gene_product=unspecified product / transcript_product=unspecified product / location=Mono_scaffold00398:13360-18357(-) / protein_length=1627 / sequence_SO=supercontig / SO=protein_coding / is_pseudo=false
MTSECIFREFTRLSNCLFGLPQELQCKYDELIAGISFVKIIDCLYYIACRCMGQNSFLLSNSIDDLILFSDDECQQQALNCILREGSPNRTLTNLISSPSTANLIQSAQTANPASHASASPSLDKDFLGNSFLTGSLSSALPSLPPVASPFCIPSLMNTAHSLLPQNGLYSKSSFLNEELEMSHNSRQEGELNENLKSKLTSSSSSSEQDSISAVTTDASQSSFASSSTKISSHLFPVVCASSPPTSSLSPLSKALHLLSHPSTFTPNSVLSCTEHDPLRLPHSETPEQSISSRFVSPLLNTHSPCSSHSPSFFSAIQFNEFFTSKYRPMSLPPTLSSFDSVDSMLFPNAAQHFPSVSSHSDSEEGREQNSKEESEKSNNYSDTQDAYPDDCNRNHESSEEDDSSTALVPYTRAGGCLQCGQSGTHLLSSNLYLSLCCLLPFLPPTVAAAVAHSSLFCREILINTAAAADLLEVKRSQMLRKKEDDDEVIGNSDENVEEKENEPADEEQELDDPTPVLLIKSLSESSLPLLQQHTPAGDIITECSTPVPSENSNETEATDYEVNKRFNLNGDSSRTSRNKASHHRLTDSFASFSKSLTQTLNSTFSSVNYEDANETSASASASASAISSASSDSSQKTLLSTNRSRFSIRSQRQSPLKNPNHFTVVPLAVPPLQPSSSNAFSSSSSSSLSSPSSSPSACAASSLRPVPATSPIGTLPLLTQFKTQPSRWNTPAASNMLLSIPPTTASMLSSVSFPLSSTLASCQSSLYASSPMQSPQQIALTPSLFYTSFALSGLSPLQSSASLPVSQSPMALSASFRKHSQTPLVSQAPTSLQPSPVVMSSPAASHCVGASNISLAASSFSPQSPLSIHSMWLKHRMECGGGGGFGDTPFPASTAPLLQLHSHHKPSAAMPSTSNTAFSAVNSRQLKDIPENEQESNGSAIDNDSNNINYNDNADNADHTNPINNVSGTETGEEDGMDAGLSQTMATKLKAIRDNNRKKEEEQQRLMEVKEKMQKQLREALTWERSHFRAFDWKHEENEKKEESNRSMELFGLSPVIDREDGEEEKKRKEGREEEEEKEEEKGNYNSCEQLEKMERSSMEEIREEEEEEENAKEEQQEHDNKCVIEEEEIHLNKSNEIEEGNEVEGKNNDAKENEEGVKNMDGKESDAVEDEKDNAFDVIQSSSEEECNENGFASEEEKEKEKGNEMNIDKEKDESVKEQTADSSESLMKDEDAIENEQVAEEVHIDLDEAKREDQPDNEDEDEDSLEATVIVKHIEEEENEEAEQKSAEERVTQQNNSPKSPSKHSRSSSPSSPSPSVQSSSSPTSHPHKSPSLSLSPSSHSSESADTSLTSSRSYSMSSPMFFPASAMLQAHSKQAGPGILCITLPLLALFLVILFGVGGFILGVSVRHSSNAHMASLEKKQQIAPLHLNNLKVDLTDYEKNLDCDCLTSGQRKDGNKAEQMKQSKEERNEQDPSIRAILYSSSKDLFPDQLSTPAKDSEIKQNNEKSRQNVNGNSFPLSSMSNSPSSFTDPMSNIPEAPNLMGLCLPLTNEWNNNKEEEQENEQMNNKQLMPPEEETHDLSNDHLHQKEISFKKNKNIDANIRPRSKFDAYNAFWDSNPANN